MQDNSTLQRFKKFADTIVSSNIPSHMLLEMAISYVSSEVNNNPLVEYVPVLDDQVSMFDTFDYEELIIA